MDIYKKLKEMLVENPNDMDLGKKVRKVIQELKEKENGIQQKDIKKR